MQVLQLETIIVTEYFQDLEFVSSMLHLFCHSTQSWHMLAISITHQYYENVPSAIALR